MKTMTKTRTRATATSKTQGLEALEIFKTTLAAIGSIPAAIGAWSVACFVSGLINSGGPIAMAKAWISAITGV